MSVRFLALDAQALFTGFAGIHVDFGLTAPQILRFDAYYNSPPVVGVQIIGDTP